METPKADSKDKLIDSDLILDSKFLVPIDDTVWPQKTETTQIDHTDQETSLELPSMNENRDSLMKTEFLDFVDELSQEDESQPLEKESSSFNEHVNESPNFSQGTTIYLSDSSKVTPSLEPVSITESQFSSTIPYLEGKSHKSEVDSKVESLPVSIQPDHKGNITLSHEGANETSEEGTSVSSTKDCVSGSPTSKTPTGITNDLSDSVSEIKVDSPTTLVEHGNMQSIETPIVKVEQAEYSTPSEIPG